MQDIVPTGHFTRVAAAQSFYVSFGSGSRDLVPPSRILDLALLPPQERTAAGGLNSEDIQYNTNTFPFRCRVQ